MNSKDKLLTILLVGISILFFAHVLNLLVVRNLYIELFLLFFMGLALVNGYLDGD
jgi:hypothetical protein